MTNQKCNISLHEKLEARAGRLQLIIAELSRLARVILDNYDNPNYDALHDKVEDELMALIGDYGPAWLDECAYLLKELYNRREGP